jgi:hypothetical protein
MGLTISYTLSMPRKLDEDTVFQLAVRTAQFARKIGCAEVGDPTAGGPDHWRLWKLPDGATTGEPVSAIGGCSVRVLAGDGCEWADFGLCRYPRIPGWKLTAFPKTQYAARHGVEHFLAYHRRLVSLLDLWRDFGVGVKVCDEGEYWQTRSLDRLRQRLGTYDRMVAAVAGVLRDAADESGPGVQAEIFSDARFERLEAEGRAEFAPKVEAVKRLLAKP